MRLFSNGAFAALALSSFALAPLTAQPRASTVQQAPKKPIVHVEIVDHGQPAYTASPMTLEARVSSSNSLPYLPVVWETSDPMHAWVSQNGTVVFLHAGKVTVTARSGEATASKTFDVRENPAARVALTAPSRARAGAPVQLAAAVLDRDGRPVAGAHVNYGVMQTGATVDDRGSFVATEPGAYTVLAEANGVADSRTIVVDGAAGVQQGSAAVERLELPAPKYTAYVGTSIPLTAELWTAGARSAQPGASEVQWSVDRSDVAAVSADGMLTALAPGEATVTARTGAATARRKIAVYPNMTARVTVSAYSHHIAPGDTVRVTVEAIAPGARAVRDARVAYGVTEPGSRDGVHATITPDGRFVATQPGVYTIFAAIGHRADQETVLVTR